MNYLIFVVHTVPNAVLEEVSEHQSFEDGLIALNTEVAWRITRVSRPSGIDEPLIGQFRFYRPGDIKTHKYASLFKFEETWTLFQSMEFAGITVFLAGER